MEKLKVQIANRQKKIKIPSGTRLLLRRCCHAVLAFEKFDKPAEVSISFIDNKEIQQLNAEFRGKNIETDVLSFPLGENGVYDKNEDTGAYMLGDIVISVEKAREQAACYGHSMKREYAFLIAHSMLHLLGYDHMDPEEAAVMEEKQEAALTALHITRQEGKSGETV